MNTTQAPETVTRTEWTQAQRMGLTTSNNGERWMLRGEAVIGGTRFVQVLVEGMGHRPSFSCTPPSIIDGGYGKPVCASCARAMTPPTLRALQEDLVQA